MSVKFTQDAEIDRINERDTWELYSSTSIVRAARTARDMGWAENKVQVREERDGDIFRYFVEPYEEGCGCRGLLRYEDYFGPIINMNEG